MRILIVDDDELSLAILEGVLDEMGYEVERASNGREALSKLRGGEIHIVITDWEMPEMNGLDLCRAIREDDFVGYVYIIMLTSRDSGQQKIEGLHAGADAFLVKPLNSEEMVVSLKTAERILSLETRDLTMFALAKLSESRDPETGAHIERVQSYARLVAQYMSTTEKHRGMIDAEFIRLIHQTSPLHDIGKVAIPDSILLKPGSLAEEEIAIMRTHVTIGANPGRVAEALPERAVFADGPGHRHVAPRALGRKRISRRNQRGADSAGGEDRVHRGRVRRTDQPASLSGCDDPFPGQDVHFAGGGTAFRPGCGGGVHAG